jgi:hypothetical protein
MGWPAGSRTMAETATRRASTFRVVVVWAGESWAKMGAAVARRPSNVFEITTSTFTMRISHTTACSSEEWITKFYFAL